MENEADIKRRLIQVEMQCDEHYERIIDNDQKWMLARPIIEKASNNNVTVGLAIAITILNLLLLLLR